MPFGGASVNKASEIGFEALINSLCLAISLWMVSTAHMKIYVKEFEKFLPQITSEHFVSVRNQSSWEAMKLEYVVQKQLGYLEGSEWMRWC